MHKSILLLALLLGVFSLSSAQGQRCFTDEIAAQMTAQYPASQRWSEDLESQYRAYIANGGASQRGGIRTIPVVVHVIQASPNIIISDARIQSQIDVLNEDFRMMNADANLVPAEFSGVAADSEIEFCLATIDPNGCPTTGINRIVSPANAAHVSNNSAALKGLIQWDPYKYLNIWVPEQIIDAILGYATFPTFLNFNPGSDGVVCNGENFGRGNGIPISTYNLGRTATHEVGHWLGLSHTFSGGCQGMTQNSCEFSGDNVCDTPPTASANYGCANTQNTCAESYPADLNDQTMNYMDYSDDRCMYMYTLGQKDRMWFYLDNIRSQIWSTGNLSATGCDGTVSPGCAPTADFTANLQSACVGQPVSFTDLSIGPPTSWSWTFTNGSPATSTDPNPQVIYTTPGIYTVSLEVTNTLGTNTETKTSYIQVVESTPAPIQESFEGIITYPPAWFTQDLDGGNTWEVTTAGASDGTNSMYINNYQGPTAGLEELISAPYDLSNIVDPTLIWDRAYKRYNAFLIDTLRVDVSSDCGNTWTNEWEGGGSGLASVGGIQVGSAFAPTAAQWKSDTLDLTAYAGYSDVRIRFQFVPGGGQNLYIDHLRMDGLVGQAEAAAPGWSFNVTNPFDQELNIRYQTARPGTVSFRLLDLQGRVLLMHQEGPKAAGNHELNLNTPALQNLPSGIYFLEGYTDAGRVSRKVVKQ